MIRTFIALSLSTLAVSQAYAGAQIWGTPYDREACLRPSDAYVWPASKIRSITSNSKTFATRYEFDREGRLIKSTLGPDTKHYEWAEGKLVKAGSATFTHFPNGWIESDFDDEFRVTVERRQDGKIIVFRTRTKTGQYAKDFDGQMLMTVYDSGCRGLTFTDSHSMSIAYPSLVTTYRPQTIHSRNIEDAWGNWSSETTSGRKHNYSKDGMLTSYVTPIKGNAIPVIDSFIYEKDLKTGRIVRAIYQRTGVDVPKPDDNQVYTYEYYE